MHTVSERLAKIRLKLDRAGSLIEELKGLEAANCKPLPEVRQCPETKRFIRDIEVKKPHTDFALIAGDAIHNLRTALDHLAFQLVMIGPTAVTNKDLTKSAFPILKEKPNQAFATLDSVKDKVKGMHPDAIKAIEALEPWP